MIKFKIKLLSEGCPPTKGSSRAAGWDLYANCYCVVRPEKTVKVPCGFQMELPEGCAAFIQPRSGLAIMNGITVANTPGLIDEDFRGEICVLLRNESDTDFYIEPGRRIAQMVVKRLEPSELQIVEELSDTERGECGFGSSGK